MKQYVYDLPTRVFHWIIAILFMATFIIGKAVDDESAQFYIHGILGIILAFVISLRIFWGLIGTKHARFSNFPLSLIKLKHYFLDILSNNEKRWAGHNPASSWMAIIMFIMGISLGISGVMMTSGAESELIEEIHELLAHGFIALVILHLTGIALHTIRHKEAIALSMINGKKHSVPLNEVISSSKSGYALFFSAIVIAFSIYAFNSFDSSTRSMQLFGTKMTFLEEEH